MEDANACWVIFAAANLEFTPVQSRLSEIIGGILDSDQMRAVKIDMDT